MSFFHVLPMCLATQLSNCHIELLSRSQLNANSVHIVWFKFDAALEASEPLFSLSLRQFQCSCLILTFRSQLLLVCSQNPIPCNFVQLYLVVCLLGVFQQLNVREAYVYLEFIILVIPSLLLQIHLLMRMLMTLVLVQRSMCTSAYSSGTAGRV